jgi:pimeloyl-ACP methyl ester carboxylesterase
VPDLTGAEHDVQALLTHRPAFSACLMHGLEKSQDFFIGDVGALRLGVVTVGNSMGAGAAAIDAAQQPDLVRGLVLLGTRWVMRESG